MKTWCRHVARSMNASRKRRNHAAWIGPLVALTGLRNPCRQIGSVGDGVMKMMFIDDPDDPDGPKIGRTGVMGVVVAGGTVDAGDEIKIRFPAGPLARMEKV